MMGHCAHLGRSVSSSIREERKILLVENLITWILEFMKVVYKFILIITNNSHINPTEMASQVVLEALPFLLVFSVLSILFICCLDLIYVVKVVSKLTLGGHNQKTNILTQSLASHVTVTGG